MFEEMIEKLNDPKSKYMTLETTPTHSASFDDVLEKIEEFQLHTKVDGFSTTDNPLAKMKYGSLFATIKLQNRFQKPVLATVSMRDKNKIALQSDLLGANDFDVRMILALTGDSAKISDQPNSKGVFEGDSTLLLDMINCFNTSIDFSGRPLKTAPKKMYGFTVMNSYAKKSKNLMKKLTKKMEHGSVGVITQPVFSVEQMKELLEMRDIARKETQKETELIFGFFPIVKFRTAQFLSAHVPGIDVPKEWLEQLHSASLESPELEEKIGMELSQNLFNDILETHSKIHIMTANKFSLADKFLK